MFFIKFLSTKIPVYLYKKIKKSKKQAWKSHCICTTRTYRSVIQFNTEFHFFLRVAILIRAALVLARYFQRDSFVKNFDERAYYLQINVICFNPFFEYFTEWVDEFIGDGLDQIGGQQIAEFARVWQLYGKRVFEAAVFKRPNIYARIHKN